MLLHTRLKSEGISSRLVIQRNTMSYDLPVEGDAVFADEDAWPRFLRMLQRKGRARIIVNAELRYNSRIAGRFDREFVALDCETIE